MGSFDSRNKQDPSVDIIFCNIQYFEKLPYIKSLEKINKHLARERNKLSLHILKHTAMQMNKICFHTLRNTTKMVLEVSKKRRK